MSADRVQGIVSKWFQEKGYGFIVVDDTRQSAFIHFSEIQGTGKKQLEVNDRVEFTLQKSDRGLRAVSLVRI